MAAARIIIDRRTRAEARRQRRNWDWGAEQRAASFLLPSLAKRSLRAVGYRPGKQGTWIGPDGERLGDLDEAVRLEFTAAALAEAEPTPDPVGEARGRVAASTHVSESEYRGAILGRNLFDATKIGTKDVDCADTPEGCGDEGDGGTPIAAMLTGTLVSDVPAYSAAFIVEDGKTSAMAYGIGQKLGEAELVEIRDDRVRFRRGTEEQWLILGQKSGEGKPKSTTASRSSSVIL